MREQRDRRGFERKAVVQDNLEGVTQPPATVPQSQGFQARAPQPRQEAFSDQVNKQVQGFLSDNLANAVTLKQDRDFVDGQVAHQQGKSFEELQIDGNKFALEGYRVVEAQALSSGLLAAQEKMINDGDFELGPDEFRAQFVDRITNIVESAPDGRTGELVRQQLLGQVEPIVAAHTKARAKFQEQSSFNALEQGIDVISRDSTAEDSLVAFATGQAGSSGLSDARRNTALISGVVRAFDNDNPNAFAVLSRHGLLDNLNSANANKLRGAQKRFEQRRRTEFDEKFFSAQTQLNNRIASGELEPTAAIEAVSALYAENSIEITAREAQSVYTQAREGNRVRTLTKEAVTHDAALRGDVDALSNIVHQGHSTGNTDISQYLQEGLSQEHLTGLTPTFKAGFSKLLEGAPPHIKKGLKIYSGYRSVSKQRRLFNARYAREKRENPNLSHEQLYKRTRKWVAPPGNSKHNHRKAADLQYNGTRLDRAPKEVRDWVHNNARAAGLNFRLSHEPWHIEQANLGSAQERAKSKLSTKLHLNSLRDNGVLDKVNTKVGNKFTTPQSVIQSIEDNGLAATVQFLQTGKGAASSSFSSTSTTDEFLSPKERLERARGALTQTREALAIEDYEAFAHSSAALGDSLSSGEISYDQWLQNNRALRAQFNQATTVASVDNEISVGKDVATELEAQRNNENALQAGRQLRTSQARLDAITDAFGQGRVIDFGNGEVRQVTSRDLENATRLATEERATIQQQFGIDRVASQELAAESKVIDQVKAALQQRQQTDEDNLTIQEAVRSGTLDQLPRNLQQRAIKQNQQQVQAQLANRAVENGADPATVDAAFQSQQLEFFGKSGLVDEDTKRVVNGFLQQEWIVDGKPNPAVVESITDIRTITDINPALLQKYIPDETTRVRVQTAINRAAGGPLDSAVFTTRNNETRPSQLQDRSEELKSARVEEALRVWSLNAANDTQVQVWGDIFQPKSDIGGSHFSGEAGVIGALLSDRADLNQLNDRSGAEFARLLDPEGDAQSLLRNSVIDEARNLVQGHEGVLSVDEAIIQAQQNIQTRGGFVGGDFVLFPKGESLVDSLFGSKAKDVDVVDASNRAILDYLRTPELRKAYPFLQQNRGISDFLLGTSASIKPFRSSVVPTSEGPALQLSVIDKFGGYSNTVVLSKKDLRKAGNGLISKIQQN